MNKLLDGIYLIPVNLISSKNNSTGEVSAILVMVQKVKHF